MNSWPFSISQAPPDPENSYITTGSQTFSGDKTFTGVTSLQNSASQLRFGEAADRGSLGAHGTIGTHISYGAYYDGANYKARQTSASTIQLGLSSILLRLVSGATVGNNITWTDAARLDATGLGVGATPTCKATIAGSVQITGVTVPSSGTGMEHEYNAGATTGTSRVYDRGGAAYKTYNIEGSTVNIRPEGTNRVVVNTAEIQFINPIRLRSYTVATLPGSPVAGQMVYVSDATGGAVVAFSNGTNWLRCDTSAVVT